MGAQITYKLMGTLWACSQEHSPFDVVGALGSALLLPPLKLTRLPLQHGTATTFLTSVSHRRRFRARTMLTCFAAQTTSRASAASAPSPSTTSTLPSVR